MTNEGIADAERSHQGWALHMLETWRGRQLFQLGRLDDAAPVLEGQLGPEEEDRLAGLLDAAGIVALGRVALHRGDDGQLERTAALARTMVGGTSTPSASSKAASFLSSSTPKLAN